jgi:tetratricopeptide (TPR) repeat protein
VRSAQFRLHIALLLALLAQPTAHCAPPTANSSCDRVVQSILNGQYARALSQLDGAPSPGRTEAERANLRGLAVMLGGDAKKSIEDFNTALDLQPAMSEAHLNRGVAFLRVGDYVHASRDFETVWSDPKSSLRARAAYHDALAMDAMHREQDAATWIKRALDTNPSLDDALLFSALLRERRGDYEAAGKAYKSFLDRHPDSVVAMLRFAITAQRAGFPDAAVAYLKKVIDAAPSSIEAEEARKFLVMWE